MTTQTRIKVWPCHAVVRYPDGRRMLPTEGASVPKVRYWLRRIACGDVTTTPPEPPKAPAKKKKTKASKATSSEG